MEHFKYIICYIILFFHFSFLFQFLLNLAASETGMNLSSLYDGELLILMQ